MKICNALIAPPGAGKSQWLINHIDQHRNEHSALAFPTLLLSEEITKRLKGLGIPFNIIDSDNVEGSVTQVLEEALCNQNDNVIICTHAALLLIDPDKLCGWKLYVDEVPSTWNCSHHSFTELHFQNTFIPLTTIVDGKKYKKLEVKQGVECAVEGLASGAEASTYNVNTTTALKALLDKKYAIEIENIDTNLYRTVRIIGINDYLSVFEAADKVTILCAELEKSLLGVILKGAGWKISPIDYNLKFSGYGNPVIIKPFLSDRNYSKTAALEKAGKPQLEWMEGCNVDKWLTKRVFKEIGHHQAIMTAHKWLQVDIPLDCRGMSNILPIKIDNRGCNDYQGYEIAICLQHGNIHPLDGHSLSTLAEMLSVENTVTEVEIKNAVKYERLYESTLQTVCRTALRDRDNKNPITLYVQDMQVAEFLVEKLGNAVIDNSLAMNPYREETEAKAKRNERKAEVVRLYTEGHSIQEIAQAIDKSERTVRDWLKPYRQLEQVTV